MTRELTTSIGRETIAIRDGAVPAEEDGYAHSSHGAGGQRGQIR